MQHCRPAAKNTQALKWPGPAAGLSLIISDTFHDIDGARQRAWILATVHIYNVIILHLYTIYIFLGARSLVVWSSRKRDDYTK